MYNVAVTRCFEDDLLIIRKAKYHQPIWSLNSASLKLQSKIRGLLFQMQWPMSFLLASHGGYNDCWFMEKWGPSNGIYSLSYWLDIFTFLLYQHKNFIWTVFNIFHFRNFVRTSVETDCVKYEEFLASSLFTFQHLWCSSAPCAVWKECLCLCSFFTVAFQVKVVSDCVKLFFLTQSLIKIKEQLTLFGTPIQLPNTREQQHLCRSPFFKRVSQWWRTLISVTLNQAC